MDGMPKGSGVGDAVGGQVASLDEMRTKLERVEGKLKRARSAGGRAIAGVKAPMRMFYEAFFLSAGSLEAACIYARIDKRTGERYRAEVYRGGRDE